ncbi:hypothetical protein ACFX2J_015626 [Malus domestica]
MAKPRKPKNEDAKPGNSGPSSATRSSTSPSTSISVAFTGSSLPSINTQTRKNTLLHIVVPEIGIVGLHAENLGIESVSVDGEQTEFEYYPQSNHKDEESERSWSWVTSPSSAADAAGASKAGSELQEQLVGDNEVQHSSGEVKQNARLVRIDYWVEKAETGIYFHDAVLHTDNQIRRARCWFPCKDDNSQTMIWSSPLHKILWLLALAAYYTRPPTLYGVPKDHKPFHLGEAESFREQKNIFAAFIPESKYVEPPSEAPNLSHGDLTVPETSSDGFAFPAASKDDLGAPEPTTDGFGAPELPSGGLGDPEPSGSGLVAEEPSIGGFAAPEPRIGSFDGLAVSEPSIVSPSNQNLEEVNSWHDLGSRMTASIGCAKLASDVDDTGKELQCTADSSKVSALPRPKDPSPSFIQDNRDAEVQKHAGVQALSVPRNDVIGGSSGMSDSLPRGKEKEKKKDEKRKRDGHKGHRDDPEYLERKRIKKVKKPKEKEMAKLLNERAKVPSAELPSPQLCNSNRSSPVDPTS